MDGAATGEGMARARSIPVAAEAGRAPEAEFLRATWALAWPVIFSFSIESFLGLCGMLMVGRLGRTAIGAVVGTVNVVLAYGLIFGRLGLPPLGVTGAAIATVVAFAAGALLGLALLARGRLVLALRGRPLRLRPDVVRRVLRIGYPAAIEHLLMQVGFFLYIVFAAHHGTAAVAAYFIGVRILSLSFLPGFGFAAAAATMIGQ